jgi:hypothetical protein
VSDRLNRPRWSGENGDCFEMLFPILLNCRRVGEYSPVNCSVFRTVQCAGFSKAIKQAFRKEIVFNSKLNLKDA